MGDPEFKYKQCLIIRTDIKMSQGKRCAQIAHAAVSACDNCGAKVRKSWLSEGQKKVVLKISDLRALYELQYLAESAGISACLIQDAGLTEVPPGTITALGLGPALCEELDKLTGDLSLL